MVKLDSLMAKDSFLLTDEDDFLVPQRERLPSETCMSSSDGMQGSVESLIPSLLYPDEQRNETSLNIDTDSISDNLLDVNSGINKDTSICSLYDEEILDAVEPKPAESKSTEEGDSSE